MSRRTNFHFDDGGINEDEEDESIMQLHSKVKLLKTVSMTT